MEEEIKYPIRINKYLAHKKICARREADKIISEGKVKINGRRAVLGDKVLENDKVSINLPKTGIKKLVYIAFNKPKGIITHSPQLGEEEIKDFFDIIILDSPPIIAVVDSEILAKQVDGTILVISADKTENRLMRDAVDLLNRNKVAFLGTVLNNFKNKSGYGYYYKYNYNYSRSSNQKGTKSLKFK